MRYLLLLVCLFCSIPSIVAQSDSIIGNWKTVDDVSGQVKSVVEIYKKGDKYYGKILKIFVEPGEDPDPICDQCDEDDDRFNQRIIGMEIIKDMIYDKDDNIFEDGDILDPENGSEYDCRLWIENGKLMVRGYILFLYRTQTWHPYEG